MNACLKALLPLVLAATSAHVGTAGAATAPSTRPARAKQPPAAPSLSVSKHEGSCHGYLAVDETSRQAVLVDAPSGAAERFLPQIKDEQLKVRAILLTHAHGDHTMDLAELARATKAPVLHRPSAWGLSRRGMMLRRGKLVAVEDGATIKVGGLRFSVMYLPGHTDDSIGFYEPMGVVFSGDTLQAGAMGGSATDPVFLRSLHRLVLLPPETDIFAGHGEVTTVKQEAGWVNSLIESEAPEILQRGAGAP